jgi:acetyl-CoA carboxylase carboxyltransferase component
MGYIRGKQCIVVANDATVKQVHGSITAKEKIYVPKKLLWKTVYQSSILDSAGVYLPLQDEIFQTKNILVVF